MQKHYLNSSICHRKNLISPLHTLFILWVGETYLEVHNVIFRLEHILPGRSFSPYLLEHHHWLLSVIVSLNLYRSSVNGFIDEVVHFISRSLKGRFARDESSTVHVQEKYVVNCKSSSHFPYLRQILCDAFPLT